jgi:hypothetical protein
LARLRPVLAAAFAALLLGGLFAAGAVTARGDDTPPGVTDPTTTTTSTDTVPVTPPPPVDMAKVRAKRKAVAFHRAAAWRWETTSLSPLAKTRYAERHTTDLQRLDRLVKWWTSVHARAEQYALNPPHFTDWMCIHAAIKNARWNRRTLQYVGGGYHVSGTGEGSWTADIGNGYYGGLQMDYGFMRTYGPTLLARKGTANHWTALEQMWVAEQAFKSRRFYPWPNTARACGLIS